MKIHDDPVAKNLAKKFGHKKNYDQNVKKNIEEVLTQVKVKYDRIINPNTVGHWMIDGPGHRYPDPELLTMVTDILGYDEVWDIWVSDKFIQINSIHPLRAELLKRVLNLEEKYLDPFLNLISVFIDLIPQPEKKKDNEFFQKAKK